MRRVRTNVVLKTMLNKLRWFFLVPVLLLAASLVMILAGWREMRAARSEARVQDEVLGELQGVLVALQDAESGQRNFLIFEDDEFLAAYQDMEIATLRRLEQLKEQAAAGRVRAETVTELELFMAQAHAEWRRTMDLAQTARGEEARSLMRAGQGKAALDQIRKKILALSAEHKEVRSRAQAKVEKIVALFGWASAMAAVVSLGFLAGAWLVLRKAAAEPVANV